MVNQIRDSNYAKHRYSKLTMRFSLLVMTLLLSACIVGPNYVRPMTPVPAKYKEATPGWKVAKPMDDCDRGPWWEIFHDPILNHLEAEVNVSNQNIASAEALYRQARALVDEARAAFFPTLTGTVSYTRQKQAAQNAPIQFSRTFNTWLLQFDATWQPDLWGSVHRTVEASKAGADASAAQLAGVRLSMQATLAQDYFQLRTLDADQELLNNTVIAYRKALDLTKRSYSQGVASLSDIALAEVQLKTAEAAAVDVGVTRATFEHAIAVLVGKPASAFSLPPDPLNVTPPPIPLELPSALLERRPDVAQAERLVAQANAQIGVAIAAFFPAVPITGTYGYMSNFFSRWFTQPTLFWSLGVAITQTILDGGLRHAQVRAAKAAYQSTVAQYRQTVIAAYQNVEDNLATLRILEEEEGVQQAAVNAAQTSVRLQLLSFKAGTVAYTAVITAQTAAYTAEKSAIDINGRRMVAAVGLIQALGGGWDIAQIPPIPGILCKGPNKSSHAVICK